MGVPKGIFSCKNDQNHTIATVLRTWEHCWIKQTRKPKSSCDMNGNSYHWNIGDKMALVRKLLVYNPKTGPDQGRPIIGWVGVIFKN